MWEKLDILYVHIFVSLCMVHESACLDYLANLHCWSHFLPFLSQDTDDKSHLYIGKKPVLLLFVLHWRSKLVRVHPSCCSASEIPIRKTVSKTSKKLHQLGRLMNSLNIIFIAWDVPPELLNPSEYKPVLIDEAAMSNATTPWNCVSLCEDLRSNEMLMERVFYLRHTHGGFSSVWVEFSSPRGLHSISVCVCSVERQLAQRFSMCFSRGG